MARVLRTAGYRLHEPGPPVYRCRSGVAVHESIGEMTPLALETTAYHGSYLAAAEVPLGSAGRVICVSVHASPTILRQEDLERWRWTLPRRRRGSTSEPPLWDSDFVLSTLGALVQTGASVLAAGDLNEARAWDLHRGGHWGEDWFAFAEELGLHDVTFRAWGEERPTHASYQDDHVLATADLLPSVRDVRVGPASGSDHASLELTLDVDL